MNDIKDFKELTEFIYSEYTKMSDSFEICQPPKLLVKKTSKTLLKYYKLYDKELLRKTKEEIKILHVIDTMPHSKLWIKFHKKLWDKVQKYIDDNQNVSPLEDTPKEEIKQTLVPEVVKEYSFVPADTDSDE